MCQSLNLADVISEETEFKEIADLATEIDLKTEDELTASSQNNDNSLEDEQIEMTNSTTNKDELKISSYNSCDDDIPSDNSPYYNPRSNSDGENDEKSMYEDHQTQFTTNIKPVIDESSIKGNVIDDQLNLVPGLITLEKVGTCGESSDEEIDQQKPAIDSMEVNVNNSSPEYVISDEDVENTREEGSNHDADSTDDEAEPYPVSDPVVESPRSPRENKTDSSPKLKVTKYKPHGHTISYVKSGKKLAYQDAEKGVHRCSKCEKSFEQRVSLEVHFNKYHGKKLFFCTECDKEFASKTGLRMHRFTHMNKADWPYICPVKWCQQKFWTKSNIPRHLMSMLHKDDNIPDPVTEREKWLKLFYTEDKAEEIKEKADEKQKEENEKFLQLTNNDMFCQLRDFNLPHDNVLKFKKISNDKYLVKCEMCHLYMKVQRANSMSPTKNEYSLEEVCKDHACRKEIGYPVLELLERQPTYLDRMKLTCILCTRPTTEKDCFRNEDVLKVHYLNAHCNRFFNAKITEFKTPYVCKFCPQNDKKSLNSWRETLFHTGITHGKLYHALKHNKFSDLSRTLKRIYPDKHMEHEKAEKRKRNVSTDGGSTNSGQREEISPVPGTSRKERSPSESRPASTLSNSSQNKRRRPSSASSSNDFQETRRRWQSGDSNTSSTTSATNPLGRIVDPNGIFICTICPLNNEESESRQLLSRFSNENYFRDHLVSKHFMLYIDDRCEAPERIINDEGERVLICGYLGCQQTFRNIEARLKHIGNEHGLVDDCLKDASIYKKAKSWAKDNISILREPRSHFIESDRIKPAWNREPEPENYDDPVQSEETSNEFMEILPSTSTGRRPGTPMPSPRRYSDDEDSDSEQENELPDSRKSNSTPSKNSLQCRECGEECATKETLRIHSCVFKLSSPQKRKGRKTSQESEQSVLSSTGSTSCTSNDDLSTFNVNENSSSSPIKLKDNVPGIKALVSEPKPSTSYQPATSNDSPEDEPSVLSVQPATIPRIILELINNDRDPTCDIRNNYVELNKDDNKNSKDPDIDTSLEDLLYDSN